MWETWVQSLGWEDPLEKGKATTPVFWPGKFHGLYGPWGRKESDRTEQLSLSQYLVSVVWTVSSCSHSLLDISVVSGEILIFALSDIF